MSYHVYILYSGSRDLFYVGVTNDLKKRLQQHNSKESGFTAWGVPWILLWATLKTSREEAELLEKKLKNLSRVRKIRFIRKYREGIQDEELWDDLVDRSH